MGGGWGSREVAQTLRHELDHVKGMKAYGSHALEVIRMGTRLGKTISSLQDAGDTNLETMSEEDLGDLSKWHLFKHAEEVRAAENDKTWATHHIYQEVQRANKKGVTPDTDSEYAANLRSLIIVRDSAQQYIDVSISNIQDAFQWEISDIYGFVDEVNSASSAMGWDSTENQKMLADRL